MESGGLARGQQVQAIVISLLLQKMAQISSVSYSLCGPFATVLLQPFTDVINICVGLTNQSSLIVSILRIPESPVSLPLSRKRGFSD